jgi:hypothetical protein
LTHEERGILSINPNSLRAAFDRAKTAKREMRRTSDDSSDLMELCVATGGRGGRNVFCDAPFGENTTDCMANSVGTGAADLDQRITTTSQFFTHLLRDIIEDTNSPSLAIQSVVTTRAKMEYFRWINTYTRQTKLVMTRTETALIPVRKLGFGLVMALITVQLALLATVAWLFFRKTRYSFLNNAWQVVAQVSETVSPATWSVLSRATMGTDSSIVRHLRWHRKRGGDDVGESWARSDMGLNTAFIVEDGTFRPVLDPVDGGQDGSGARYRRNGTKPYRQVPGLESM